VRRTTDREPQAWPEPFGALAGEVPELGMDDVKAARRDALIGKKR
jgi:hypothetical protein